MKKLFYMFLVAALLGGSIAIASAHQGADDPKGDDHGQNSGTEHATAEVGGRERITSPSDIKNFRDIIRVGKDLYGFRISGEAGLERIPSPADIKDFDGVKRVGNALWGHRRGSNWTMVSSEAKACVAAAITKKDGAIKTALNKFNSDTIAAIDARTSCQIGALNSDSASGQMKANMTCKANYQAAMKTSLKTVAEARGSAWKAYTSDLKACNPKAEIKIEDGGNLEDSLK